MAADAFDTANMSNALNDVTNKKGNMNVEAAAVAREKGWVAPQDYDYSKYTNANPLQKPAEGDNPEEQPKWAAKAAKYEWSEEFGDVGPPNPELEKMLFHSEYLNRAGLKFEK